MNFLSVSIIASAVISLMAFALGESYEKPVDELQEGAQVEEVAKHPPIK
ncbi:MAG: hypothetical protein AB8G05_10300 [Oligoflexales bacterium]